MQEPYGAYSWYPVNDQPSDKALYDISVVGAVPVDRDRQRAAGLDVLLERPALPARS